MYGTYGVESVLAKDGVAFAVGGCVGCGREKSALGLSRLCANRNFLSQKRDIFARKVLYAAV